MVFSSFLVLAIAVLLLFSGIGLVKRRRSAIRLGVIWAIAKVVFVVPQSVVGMSMQEEQLAAMAEQGPNMPQLGSAFVAAIVALSLVMNIAWGWALPVFLLIWFSRAKIKAEVAGWEGGERSSLS